MREDLRDLSRIQLPSHVEELVELLVLRTGGILSYNALREDLQVALDSVRLWVAYLERLYFVYKVRPFAARLPRALRREPKLSCGTGPRSAIPRCASRTWWPATC